ncbi:MAG: hypothetical protein ACRDZ7_11835 [Acidimicrobiia bacterium]
MDDADFERWRDELVDSPESPENIVVRLHAALVKAGFEPLGEPEPCVFCGRPSGWRDPEGVVRHPDCPRTEEERARLEEGRDLQTQLRADLERQRQIREHLSRRKGPSPGEPTA